ncbi:MAG: uroporphyrinogen-III synthase [Gammaproteobacteria bacterium]
MFNCLAFAGLTVLVTRPAAQAKFLSDAIIKQGGKAILFPTLEIQALPDRAPLLKVMRHLTEYNLAIFVSSNAVKQTVADWPSAHPKQLKIIAIGAGTAKILQQHGLPPHILSPPPFSSEALLTLPELTNVQGQRILIFCGEKGKALLADTLQRRGADVITVPVYRRLRPAPPTTAQCQQWQRQPIDIIISTSCESLQNLHDLLITKSDWLKKIPLIVISHHMAHLARDLGFTPYVATKASDTALLDALKIWYDNAK